MLSHMSDDPIKRRDDGLKRLSTITKGTVAGGLVLTGALSALAAHSFTGTSSASTAATTATASESTATTATTTPSYNSQLSSPSSGVRSSSGSGRVTSGGS